MEDKKLIYMDNAATTKTYPEVVEAMIPFFSEHYGNASSLYQLGAASKKAMNDARHIIAESIGAQDKEIYFTAGGTEGDNWALLATTEFYKDKGRHIITSAIEHHAILHTCEHLAKQGYEITYLPVDENGLVSPDDLRDAIREDTVLVSIMLANNEIGTIEPIKELAAVAHEKGVLFHTDAVQAYCHIPIDVNDLGVDMLSASGHKYHGPKGVGFFYIKNGVKIRSLIHGGAQERKRRAGTENIPGIVGMGKAAQMGLASLERRMENETKLRDHMIERVLAEIPFAKLNGHREIRLPNNANFSFRFIEGESMLIMLDMRGICGSSGSACASGSLDPSHVLMAIGLPHEIAHGSLRLSISEETTMEEVDAVVDALKDIVANLRAMSPLYEDYAKKHPEEITA